MFCFLNENNRDTLLKQSIFHKWPIENEIKRKQFNKNIN